jgi:hypothetical protein
LKTDTSGKVSIVQDLPISDYAQEKIDLTTQELLEEKNDIKDLL